MQRRQIAVALGVLALVGTAFAADPPRIRMFELYNEDKDRTFSATARRLAGKTVTVQGFMAPHLKVDSDFFVLSNQPVETCPFCASEDQWIDTIIFVRMKKRQQAANPGDLILVEGRLEIGPETDKLTGFTSRVRLVDASFRVL